jgi:hypothetical protein
LLGGHRHRYAHARHVHIHVGLAAPFGAWNASAHVAQVYVNDVPDLASGATVNNDTNCYVLAAWGIGGVSSAELDADVADLYANFNVFLDLSVPANHRLFDDGAGHPVDLGPTCNAPTNSTPNICDTGSASTWHINQGVAGGFNNGGPALTVAPTSPSD